MAFGPLFPNGFMPALQNNSDTLLQTGLGLLSGSNPQQQAGMAAQGFAGVRQKNKTAATLRAAGYNDLADGVENGSLSGNDAFKLFYAQKLESQKPKNNFMSAGGSLYDLDSHQWLTPPASAGGGEYGLNVIYGTDATTGKTGIGQVGKDGSFHLVDTKGFQPVGNTSNLNLGTTYQTRDKAGNVLSSAPIDNAGAASDTKLGNAQGDARAAYNSMASKMPGLQAVVTKLDDLADKATYTGAGQMLDMGMKQIGLPPREAALARTEYISTVDNQVLPLLRDTFGAAFTEREGDSLRNTLGDPNKTPQEKKIVLHSFIEQKQRDLGALATQSGQAPAGGGPTPNVDDLVKKYGG